MMLFNLKLKFSLSFSKISQIFHLQSRHIILLLLRMNFSSYEYTSKTLVYNFKSLKLCIIWTTINWLTIIIFIFMFFEYLPTYCKIYGGVLGIEKTYHRFSMMATSSFIIAEFNWLAAFTEHISGKNKALDLVFELSGLQEIDLTSAQQEKQICWFNRAHFFIQMYIKEVYAGIAIQMFVIYGLIFKSYFNGEISVLEIPLYIFICTSSNQLGGFAILFSTNFVNDLFFMIGIFKC